MPTDQVYVYYNEQDGSIRVWSFDDANKNPVLSSIVGNCPVLIVHRSMVEPIIGGSNPDLWMVDTKTLTVVKRPQQVQPFMNEETFRIVDTFNPQADVLIQYKRSHKMLKINLNPARGNPSKPEHIFYLCEPYEPLLMKMVITLDASDEYTNAVDIGDFGVFVQPGYESYSFEVIE